MLITQTELIVLLFAELNKSMRPKALSLDVVELFSMLQERCILDVGSSKLVDLADYDLQRESVRYVSFILNEFDNYYERCISRQSRLERILYVVGNYRGRCTILSAQEFLLRFFYLLRCCGDYFIYKRAIS